MNRNREIIDSVSADLRLEGMIMTASEKRVLMDCLTGKTSYADAVAQIIARYKEPVA